MHCIKHPVKHAETICAPFCRSTTGRPPFAQHEGGGVSQPPALRKFLFSIMCACGTARAKACQLHSSNQRLGSERSPRLCKTCLFRSDTEMLASCFALAHANAGTRGKTNTSVSCFNQPHNRCLPPTDTFCCFSFAL